MQLPQSLESHRRAVEITRKTLGPEHTNTMEYQVNLGRALLNAEKYDEAEQLLQGTIDVLQKKGDKVILPHAQANLLDVLVKRKQYAQVEPKLLAHYEHARSYEVEAMRPALVKDALKMLVELYDAWGKPAEAAKYRALLPKPTTQAS